MMKSMMLMGAVFVLVTARAPAQDRPALGITLDDDTNGKASAGVVITNVVAGGPAAQAGLLAGDRITAIDKKPVSSSADVIKIIASSSVNKQIVLDVTRGPWRASLSATLGEMDQVFRAPPPTPAVTTTSYYQETPSYQYDAPARSYRSGGPFSGWYRVGNVIINGRRWGDIGYRYSHADLVRW